MKQRHISYTASIYKGLTPAERASWWRKERRRSTFQDGVLIMRFIKTSKPERPKRCRWCGKEEANDKGLCIDCFLIWRGQKLPEPGVPA